MYIYVIAINAFLRILIFSNHPSHIGAKAFLKEHFSNTSISTRYFFNYYAVLGYILCKYLVDKQMDKNENAPLKKISPHCGQESVMLIFSFHLILKDLHLCHFYVDIAAKYVDQFPLISTYLN